MMKEIKFKIGHIPALLLGENSDNIFLFVHGQGGYKEEAIAFAEIVCPAGWQVISIDLPEHGERKGGTEALNPWTVVPELETVMTYLKGKWKHIALRANSIGAWFSMLAFAKDPLKQALFVSPMVDMEKLITDMMGWVNVTEEELQQRSEIATDFGQTLSWEYLCYVRKHPVCWNIPTKILYAGRDNLVSCETMDGFVQKYSAVLTVMKNGEHWFHTPEQLAVLEKWEKESF